MAVGVVVTMQVGEEVKRTALGQVLESRTFARCDQLKHFLRYVCDLELAGRGAEIHEYLIGVEALGRPKDFSPQDDSTVRSRAYSLRQKLQEYYEHESPEAPIRIELPKGSYNPLFVEASSTTQRGESRPSDVPAHPSQSAGRPMRSLAISFAAGAALMALLWVTTAWLNHRNSAKATIDPIVTEAWGPLARPNANVAVCVSSPPHLHLQAYADGPAGVPFHNPLLLPATPEITAFYESFRLSKPGTPVYMWRTTNSTLLGVTLGVAGAVRTLASLGASFEVIPEKVAGQLALRGRNIMRFGSPLDSSEIAFDLSRVPFSISFDPSIGEEVISGKPSGKPVRVFIPKRDRDMTYGLLTVMPTDDSSGSRTVIGSGISSAGTHAAIEFFRSPRHLRELKSRLNAEGYRSFPRAYQVIVQCVAMNSVEINFTYVAHFVMK